MVICKSPEVYRGIRAAEFPEGAELSTHSLLHDDPRVKLALETFGEATRMIVSVMRDHYAQFGADTANADSPSTICRSLVDFICQQEEFPIPSFDADFKGFVRVVSFADAVFPIAGERWSNPVPAGHPAPNPVSALCRSTTSWLSFLFENRASDTYPYLRNIQAHPACSTAVSCTLLPACKDCDAFSCPYCLAGDVLRNKGDFPGLTDEQYQLLHEVRSGERPGEDASDVVRFIQASLDSPWVSPWVRH